MLFLILLNVLLVYMICSFFKKLSVFYVVYFALIILNSEILSIFSLFDLKNISILTIVESVVAYIFFVKSKTKPYPITINLTKIKTALKLDKMLFFTCIAFLFMTVCFFFLAISTPPLEPDARSYHFVRIFSYIKQANFSHFLTNEIRNTIMPINSEIIYSYFYLFKKNDVGFGLLSYFSFINAIVQLYLIMKNIKFSSRKTLFTLFSLSSMGAILVQIPSLQTDIVVATLVLTSIQLLFKITKTSLFLSALAYSLALGTKTTAILIFPAFLILLFYLVRNKKHLLYYFGFLGLNFFIFSSYNYILNFLEFGDFLSSMNLKIEHKPEIKEIFENMKYFLFDFVGGKIALLLNLQTKNTIAVPFDERTVGFSLLGVVGFLFSVFYSIFQGFCHKRNKIILVFGIMFLVNFFIVGINFAYSPYIIRYFVTFVLLSGVVVSSLYNIKILKNFILSLCIINLLLYSVFSTRCPVHLLLKGNSKETILKNQQDSAINIQLGFLNAFKTKFEKEDKVAIIDEDYFYEIKQLMNFGYNVGVLTLGELNKENLSKYDYLVFRFYNEFSNNPKYFDTKTKYKCDYFVKEYKNEKYPIARRCFFSGKDLNEFGFYFDEKIEVKNKGLYIYKNSKMK